MKHVILTRGYSALVDNEDKEWLDQYQWQVMPGHKTYYATKTYSYKTGQQTTHRMSTIILKYYNKYDGSLKVDHINRNGLDNQKHNLRMVTNQINGINRNLLSNNTSGFRGVYQHGDKWKAMIRVNDKLIYVGIYKTKIEAALAYNRVATAAFGNYAVLNIINTGEL